MQQCGMGKLYLYKTSEVFPNLGGLVLSYRLNFYSETEQKKYYYVLLNGKISKRFLRRRQGYAAVTKTNKRKN